MVFGYGICVCVEKTEISEDYVVCSLVGWGVWMWCVGGVGGEKMNDAFVIVGMGMEKN